MSSLPEKQAKRIVAYFFLGFSQIEIAELEGNSKMAVCSSIARGLRALEDQLKSFFA
ncbi:MAG: sigma factor-like helix-turn-helix DNA-binding protein [Eubacteriales bacterium]|nr:sigma factor-like helix-turn-helix DNA-binding protein [Eubacteriales bacterium]